MTEPSPSPDAMALALMRVIADEMRVRAWTQERMGAALDPPLTQGEVSKMLKGTRSITSRQLLAMCSALGVPLSVVADRATARVELGD